jgi:putative membrane protein
MIPYAALPTVNALLNTTSACLLVAAYIAIRGGRRARHRTLMLAAVATSTLFLISYLVYHAHAGTTRFTGAPPVRIVYLAILATHTVLAAAIVPLVILTLGRALRGDFARHRRIARLTFPIWLYVSVTGVVIYLMLYHR